MNMKTVTNTAIIANITTAIVSSVFQGALTWNLVGTRIDKAFLNGYAKVVPNGVVIDFEEGEEAFLIECSQQEAHLVFSCFHNKGLFLDVLGSVIYTGNVGFGSDPLEEFNEPAVEIAWELVGPTWTEANRMAWSMSEYWFYLTDMEQWEVDQELEARQRAAEREENRIDSLYEERMLAMEERQYD